MITWSYGMTTVPERIHDGLTKRTPDSLYSAGFEYPTLFIDGDLPNEPSWMAGYPRVIRSPRARTYGNWCLSAWELYIRNPKADRYAIFQDDFVTVRNLRQYLDTVDYPTDGYLNLYTFPQNEKELAGFYLSNQLGKGAVALVFSNEALRTLLSAKHWVDRPLNEHRGWRNIDGGIVTAMKKSGWKEYVHNPSLVQHTGEKSAMGNAKHEQSRTFPGEDFDAATLISKTPDPIPAVHSETHTPRTRKIGLVGYACNTGIGELNRQMATYADISAWLVVPHRRHATWAPMEGIETFIHKREEHIDRFLDRVDCVVFAETPFYESIVYKAKAQGKRVCCVPMFEWLPKDLMGWPAHVDLFICPTLQSCNLLKNQLPCVHFPWPFDSDRFKFRQRTAVERFLFLNGNGGWNGRKGLTTILGAKKIWPEMPLIVRSQIPVDGIASVDAAESNADLYSEGDVLLLPHTIDGLGLEHMEALSSGMPVVATDGEPWNELPTYKLNAKKTKRIIRSEVDWYVPDPADLVRICQELLSKDISSESIAVRQYAEQRRWQGMANEFKLLVRTGEQRITVPFEPTVGATA